MSTVGGPPPGLGGEPPSESALSLSGSGSFSDAGQQNLTMLVIATPQGLHYMIPTIHEGPLPVPSRATFMANFAVRDRDEAASTVDPYSGNQVPLEDLLQ
eukprot:gene5785-5712_t